MKKNKNDNLYKFSRDNPWQFCFVVILYLIGASGIPNGLFGFVTGTGMNGQFVSQVIVKLICCILPVWLITEIKGTKIFCLKGYFKSFLFIIPFLLVAVNNFPIFSVLSGDAIFTDNLTILNWILYIFAILCGVLVEELCFRGLVFPVLLRRFSGKQKWLLFSRFNFFLPFWSGTYSESAGRGFNSERSYADWLLTSDRWNVCYIFP